MSETVLVADTGRATGSANARRMRHDDAIPGVVYGRGMDPLSISVPRRDLRIALSGPAGINTVLDLTVDGTVYPAIVKELQRHPVRRTVQHVDFIQINLDEEIVVSVPVHLVGEAKDVLNNGALVDASMDSIEVRTTPRNIPDEIVVDVSEMTMDTTITLGDITFPSGVTPVGEDDWAVVTVLTMKTPVLDEEEAAAAEAAELAEGEEGEEGGAGEAGEGGAAGDGDTSGADDAGE